MFDELVIGDLVVRQRKLKKQDKLNHSHDVVIAGLSWESRGPIAFGNLNTIGAPLTLFKFKSRSDDVEADEMPADGFVPSAGSSLSSERT